MCASVRCGASVSGPVVSHRPTPARSCWHGHSTWSLVLVPAGAGPSAMSHLGTAAAPGADAGSAALTPPFPPGPTAAAAATSGLQGEMDDVAALQRKLSQPLLSSAAPPAMPLPAQQQAALAPPQRESSTVSLMVHRGYAAMDWAPDNNQEGT